MTEAKTFKEAFERDLASLEKARDELRVQLHLAKANARDDFQLLEKTYERLEEELKRTVEQTKGPVKEMGTAARGLVDELKRGYARIRSEIQEITSSSHQ